MEETMNGEEKSFAELFEEGYSGGGGEGLLPGEKIKGEIISIGMDTVFVNAGAKIDGAVDRKELLDDEGNLPYRVGDVLELYVVSADENELRLSRALSEGSPELIREAYQQKTPVEGKVKSVIKGGFQVEVMKRRAFCPISQIDIGYTEKPENYVGQTFHFMIIKYEDRGRNIVVSRREILAKELEAKKAEFMETLEEGAVLEGKVRSLADYGAFVELFPGVEGLVHISELHWSRVEKPEDVVHKNDKVRVKVMAIEEKPKGVRISLSMKQVEGDPWESEAPKLNVGDVLKGKVTRCAPFGAFVELFPGVEGMVHVSEMSYVKRVHKPEDEVSPGDEVDVAVKSVDLAARRISLSMREAEGDPWADATTRFPVGSKVEGTLEKKEKFGYFVALAPGVTGLLPKSKLKSSPRAAEVERVRPGDKLTLIVDAVDPSGRKITLGVGGAEGESDWKSFRAEPGGGESMGILGDALKQALGPRKKSGD